MRKKSGLLARETTVQTRYLSHLSVQWPLGESKPVLPCCLLADGLLTLLEFLNERSQIEGVCQELSELTLNTEGINADSI